MDLIADALTHVARWGATPEALSALRALADDPPSEARRAKFMAWLREHFPGRADRVESLGYHV